MTWRLVLVLFLIPLTTQAKETIRLLCDGPECINAMEKDLAKYEEVTGARIELVSPTADPKANPKSREKIDATFGPPPISAIKEAEARGEPRKNVHDFLWTPFIRHYVRFGMHPDVKVLSLTVEQIQGILSGKISNWKEISGQNLPIKVFVTKSFTKTNSEVLRLYLKSDVQPAHLHKIADQAALLKVISTTQGSFTPLPSSHAAQSFKPKSIKTIRLSHLDRVTGLTIKKKTARPEVQALFEYMKARGFKDGN